MKVRERGEQRFEGVDDVAGWASYCKCSLRPVNYTVENFLPVDSSIELGIIYVVRINVRKRVKVDRNLRSCTFTAARLCHLVTVAWRPVRTYNAWASPPAVRVCSMTAGTRPLRLPL